jgi:flagellar protein FliO/FliZ
MALETSPLRSSLPAVVLLLLPISAAAQNGPAGQDLGASALQLVLGLALVIVLLFASLWLLKRLTSPRGEAAGLLRVVAGVAVGTRERVVVVEVGDSWLVLGVAPGRVSALAEVARQNLPPTTAAPTAKEFAGRLRQLLERSRAR